jgi:hypothetical protein
MGRYLDLLRDPASENTESQSRDKSDISDQSHAAVEGGAETRGIGGVLSLSSLMSHSPSADGDATGQLRFGLPEIPEEPLLLRDGRRLWRFRAGEDTEREQAAELIQQAHRHGAVLVADGRELVIVERWLSNLPREALVELRRCAAAVITELLSRARVRWRESGETP